MDLEIPTYLGSLRNNIEQRPVPWDGAVRDGSLTEEHLAKIRACDKLKASNHRDARTRLVEADLDGYRLLFVGGPGKKSVLELAASRQNVKVIQYILVLLSRSLDSAYLPSPSPLTCRISGSTLCRRGLELHVPP